MFRGPWRENGLDQGEDAIASQLQTPCVGALHDEDASAEPAPRILVVEDERFVALDLKAMLGRLGYTVAGVAGSGTAALELCHALRPDLVLVDIVLPGGMDGVDTAGRLRAECDVPVVYLTAHADREILERAKRTAPHGFVPKPVNEGQLRAAVDVALCKHRAEQALRRGEQRYRQLFDGMLNAFLLLERLEGESGDAFRILDANAAFEKAARLTRAEVRGRPLEDVLPGIESYWLERFREAATSGRPVRFENYLTDLDRYFVAQAYCPQPGQVAVALEDVTERKRGEERLRYHTFHDALTGLANRALCLDRIARAIQRARRRSGDAFALMFLDLDRFKRINDSLGHLAGDELLRRVAERLLRDARPLDTVARVGGDEFVVLLEEIGSAAEGLRVAKALRDRLRHPFTIEGRHFHVTASLGLALGTADYTRPEELLQNAAIAMSQARRHGPGRVRVFEWSMRERAERVMDLETSLRDALENGEFVLHYQPIFSLRTLEPVGVEALVRWRRPGSGLVPPGDFIPAAEQTGCIIPLGALVLRLACQAMARLRRGIVGERPFSMAVNLSACQFSEPDLVRQVVRTLREAGVAPADLKLEITESVLMDNPESALLKLRGFKELGVGIGIDDFGTGYSSLSYLQRFPIDTLKVDRGFVSGMEEHGNMVIVRSVVNLAHNLGYAVVAEGIESLSQLDELSGLGCDMGQGFYYSRPLDEAGLLELLGRHWGGGEAV